MSFKIEDTEYYKNTRVDILPIVPNETKRLLSIGCGSGNTEKLLKDYFGIDLVVGIEKELAIAETAQERLDIVHVESIESIELPYPDNYFDVIMCLDVLEHLYDPWSCLQDKLLPVLSATGTLILSLPNIWYYTVIWDLVCGNWEYNPGGGVMDITHIRFFTPKSMRKMLFDTGFKQLKFYNVWDLRNAARNQLPHEIVNQILPQTTGSVKLKANRMLSKIPYLGYFMLNQMIITAQKATVV